MKALTLVALMAVALSGCASKPSWEDYAAKNNCQPTGNYDVKKETVMTNMSAGAGSSQGYNGGVATFSVPRVNIRRVYQYQCGNGTIWAYDAPKKATEMVASQRQ